MKNILTKKINLNFYEFLIFIFPLVVTLRSFILNLYLVIISLLTLVLIIKKKIEIHYIYKFFLLFLIYIFINSFFSVDTHKSIVSSFSQIRFFLFSIFLYNFASRSLFEKIKYYWLFFIVFISIDCYLQLYSGKNIFGFAYDQNYFRLSGVFNDEYIVGYYIAIFSLIAVSLIKKNFQSKSAIFQDSLIIFLLIFFNITVLITGERTSFLIILVSTFLFITLMFDIKKIIYFFIILIPIFFTIFTKSNLFDDRYTEVVKIIKNIPDSSYGRIFSSAFELWKNNKVTGVGLKNYRIECPNLRDPDINNQYPYCANHPHNYLLELLVETGLVGSLLYMYFLSYIIISITKNFLNKHIKNKIKSDPFILMSFILLLSYTMPIKTSGSIFSTLNASIFWFVIAINSSFLKNLK